MTIFEPGKSRRTMLQVDDDRPVGHGGCVGRVLVLLALPLERSVIDEHAVDGPGRDAEEEARRPQLEKVLVRFPVRAIDDPHLPAFGVQHPGDDTGGGQGMVGVGLARDEDDVETRACLGDHGGPILSRRGRDEQRLGDKDRDRLATEIDVMDPARRCHQPGIMAFSFFSGRYCR